MPIGSAAKPGTRTHSLARSRSSSRLPVATDPDGDALTYALAGSAAHSIVTMDRADPLRTEICLAAA